MQFIYTSTSQDTQTGSIIHFREPKETPVKTTRIGTIKDTDLCPVNLLLFIDKHQHLQTSLAINYTLFFAYIEKPDKAASIRPSTLTN